MRRLCLAIAILLPAVVCAQSPSERLTKFFAETFEQQLRDQPEFATNAGRHEYDDRWTDWSKAARELRRTHLQERLKQLDAIPLDGVSDEDRLSARLFHYDTQQQLDAYDLQNLLLSVGQLFGFHNNVYSVIDRMPGRTERDYENILSRLGSVPGFVDQNITRMDEAIARGWVQPKVVVDQVLAQIDAQLAQNSSNTPLLALFRRFPSNIPAAEQEKLRADGVTLYDKQFLPAWRKLRDYIASTYAPHARPGIGLGSLPGGKDAYAILIRRYTTTNLSADEIHKIGERELARIETEMLALAKQTGFSGTLPEFEAKLDADPAQHFKSKEEMLVYCRNVAKLIEPNLPTQFKHIPVLLYGVRAIPEDREAATASNAQAAAPDGSTPGWFNLNTYQPEKQARSNKESLVLHEAVPGHVYQGAMARAIQGAPEFRKFYGNSAYGEGWALYAESLGEPLGVYKDPISRFGQLSSERFRAVRLVVDTGMHAQGWTREQAIEFFKLHVPDQSLAEIDRYISWPGQCLSYKIGQLKIRELRTQAEQKLGAKFDVRDFHDVVLRDGTLPLDLLQEQVEHYIAATH
jgi:uncharacterized protein (DUF885 family)